MSNQSVFVVKKTSWHCRWIVFVYAMSNLVLYLEWRKFNKQSVTPFLDYYEIRTWFPYEFCMYWRAVLLWPAIKILWSVTTISLILYLTYSLGLNSISMGIIYISMVVAAFFGFLFLFALVSSGLKKLKKKKNFNDKPGFMKTLYKSYKNKYCPAVEYEKE